MNCSISPEPSNENNYSGLSTTKILGVIFGIFEALIIVVIANYIIKYHKNKKKNDKNSNSSSILPEKMN